MLCYKKMSNILIIKHGSLGDLVQISGVLKDLRERHVDKRIFILTTKPYIELLNKCPYIDEVLLDNRLPRWNVYYLYKLRKYINKFKFTHLYDLQNSSRTSFYRKYLFNIPICSSSETVLKKGEKKSSFDEYSVLSRFEYQLNNSGVKTKYSLQPNFSWSALNVEEILGRYVKKKFILLFPFCSPQLSHKKWPHYNDLINIINEKYKNIQVLIVPGPNEIEMAKEINSTSI
jgi:ADP-heptose:LPS heptosyltransferase